MGSERFLAKQTRTVEAMMKRLIELRPGGLAQCSCLWALRWTNGLPLCSNPGSVTRRGDRQGKPNIGGMLDGEAENFAGREAYRTRVCCR